MQLNLKTGSLICFTAVLLSACLKDKNIVNNPPNGDEETELITTVQMFFDDTTASNQDAIFEFNDPDGPGGNDPLRFDTIQLKANTTYNVQIVLLDKSKNPVDTISNEVAEDANDHFFVFKFIGPSVDLKYLDEDSNNPPLPLGLKTEWKTKAAGNGTSTVILKHQVGVKDGTESPGETDIQVDFPLEIK